MPTVQKGKRRPGRPRKDGTRSDNQREEIISAAIVCFSRNGYAGTTMHEIADEAGIGYSSLYYWFNSKEKILSAVLEKYETSARLAARIGTQAQGDDEIIQLAAIIYADVSMMCSYPFDYFDLEEAASSDKTLNSFFSTYRSLFDTVHDLIGKGNEHGILHAANPEMSTMVVLTLDEGMQHCFHRREIDSRWSILPLNKDGEKMSLTEIAESTTVSALNLLGYEQDPFAVLDEARQRGWIE
jgi:TetR/AcrR family transcriptional regulator